MKPITVLEFQAAFKSRTAAAEALGVTRQALYKWEKENHGDIPDPYDYKAHAILTEIDQT